MVSISDLHKVSELRTLLPKDINRLISFQGIVIKCSEIYPEMKRAQFRCIMCSGEIAVDLENAAVKQPTDCHFCKRKDTM